MYKTATLKSYSTGFAFAIALTLLSFGVVFLHDSSGHQFLSHLLVKIFLITLALIQLAVQMNYFLHLGQESKSKNNLITFWLTILFVAIVVGGSLWIMKNLNHNMSDSEMKEYMYKEVGI